MLIIKSLDYTLDGHPILRSISFTLSEGEIVGFVGNNGAGKTTTLEILSQCLHPTSGSITWNEEDIWSSNTYRSLMGYVPDQLPLYPNATVYENLLYTVELRQIDRPQNRVEELIKEFELSPVAQSAVRTLSKGWRQWVGLAQAWCHKPKLLLLDEPTSGLDPSGRQRFEAWLRRVRTEGTTVFFSSHILSEVEAVSDRVLWIEDGRIIEGNVIDVDHSVYRRTSRPSVVTTLLESIDGISSVYIEGSLNHALLPPQCAV